MGNKEIKLTFLGDVTCDRPMLKAARQADGSYDFERSLAGLKPVLEDSDYVIANLETVFAGEKLGYNPKPVTYNSPDALCYALKSIGIDMLTTANNHCLDCGREGLVRTLQLLEQCGFDHTGTFTQDYREDRFFVKTIGDIRVAFVALTDSMNSKSNGTAHTQEEWDLVNQLRQRRQTMSGNFVKRAMKKVLPMEIVSKIRASIKRKKGIPLVAPKVDNYDIDPRDASQIQWAIQLLQEAKSKSDFVVAYVHCGGQFNEEPGTHSVQLFDMLEPYADAIVGHHPHVVQKMEINNGKIRAYSLGSVNMSPSADYITHEFAPEYSVALHLYIQKENDSAKISKVSFSMLRATEDESHYVTVCGANDNTDKSYVKVYNRFWGETCSNGDRSLIALITY